MLWVEATCLPTKQFNEIYGDLKKKEIDNYIYQFYYFPL